MRRQAWWMQAAELGMVAGLSIWMVCTVIVLLGSFVVAWGPAAFLHRAGFAGLYLTIVLLAFTAPIWVIGGLMVLVSLGSREMQEERATNTERGTAENSGRNVSDAGERSRTFWREWSCRWDSIEQGIVDWLVLRPALLEHHFELTRARGNSYLRRYLKGWLVGSVSLFVVLSMIVLGTRAKFAPDDTSLGGYFAAVTLLEFALGIGLCSLLFARYVVTSVILKRRVAESA